MMNPYGQFFGIPQPYYGAVPTAYPSFVPTPIVYAPVSIPPPQVPIPEAPITTTASIEVVVQVVTQDKTPVTTVFVGNISERAPDNLIKTLLMRCGNILSWKRVQGASGKLQAFGFCEYQDPESTMRCVRLLNSFEIINKKLLVKVDPKTEDILNEYKKKKQKDGEDGSLGSTETEVDEETKKDDDNVRTALYEILKETTATLQLGHESPNRQDYLEGPRHLTLDDMDLDGDRKDLINKEIETFRRRNENETPTDDRTRRPRDEYYPRYATWSRADRESERTYTKHSRSRSRSHESSKKRHRGSTSTGHSRSSHVDEEEEAIKKKLERKLREKEESYQERLKKWESRERKKHQEYEREKEREKKKQEELQEEAHNLHDFFEDYDDDVEDPKYYKGSNLQRRLADREVEEAADERDRQKEIEQLEVARRKLIEERDPNAESIILQMEQKMQEHRQKRLNLNETVTPDNRYSSHNQHSPQNRSITNETSNEVTPKSGFVEANQENGQSNLYPPEIMDTSLHHSPNRLKNKCANDVDMPLSEASKECGFTRKDSGTFLFSMSSKQSDSKAKPAAAFADDEPEQKAPKRPLSWLPPSANSSLHQPLPPSLEQPVSQLTLAEKKEVIKQIIERIPTSKDDLFAYPIDWKVVDLDFVNTRIKPWVDKKIVAYIGESEATLSNFICEQVLEHNPPAKILTEIAMVLEEEAEVFVFKMWRLLIYFIAEKNLGLSV